MKTFVRRTAYTSIAILLLLGGTTAAFATTPRTLNATMDGAVTNLGTQVYNVSGGQVAYSFIGGNPTDAGTATIQYNLQATQSGLSTRGSATLQFSATVGGMPVAVKGTFNVNNIDPGAALPMGCTTNCQTLLPFDFIATTSNAQLTQGTTTQSTPLSLAIESPYWNPWGGPIYVVSVTNGAPDGMIVIAATYNQGTIIWMGAQTGGTITGTLGGSPVSGTFTQNTAEYENLVTGNAYDAGTIRFTTNQPSLNGLGMYTGSSTIPQPLPPAQSDCSPSMLPGTCTLTGFASQGNFRMTGVSGSYSTSWGVPAYQFQSTVLASVSGQHQSGNFWNLWQ